jgi:putative ABC transport system permease protein
VGDVKYRGLEKEIQPHVYCSWQQAHTLPVRNLVLRTASDPMQLAASVREVIRSVERERPILAMRTMKQRIDNCFLPQRFQTTLASIFSAIGLVLATVGIYGVISFSVAQRVREFGIRMALGARGSDILAGVLRQGLRLVAVGVVIGLLGACALTRVLASFLYHVSPTDPVTFLCVSLLLAGIALLACYIPARRAARIDPMQALRYE